MYCISLIINVFILNRPKSTTVFQLFYRTDGYGKLHKVTSRYRMWWILDTFWLQHFKYIITSSCYRSFYGQRKASPKLCSEHHQIPESSENAIYHFCIAAGIYFYCIFVCPCFVVFLFFLLIIPLLKIKH